MRARVAQVTVEVMRGKRRLRTGQFEQLFTGKQCDLGGQYLCFADRHRCTGNVVFAWRMPLRCNGVQRTRRTLEQRLGSVQLDVKMTHLTYHERIVAGALDSAIDPWTRALADELQRVVYRRPPDTRIDCRLDDLGNRAIERRHVRYAKGRKYVGCRDAYLVRDNRTARGGALTEAGPVIDNLQARGTRWNVGKPATAFIVEAKDRHVVREQRTGRIELRTVDDILAALGRDACLQVEDVLSALLREAVAETLALQYLAEEELLLLWGSR